MNSDFSDTTEYLFVSRSLRLLLTSNYINRELTLGKKLDQI